MNESQEANFSRLLYAENLTGKEIYRYPDPVLETKQLDKGVLIQVSEDQVENFIEWMTSPEIFEKVNFLPIIAHTSTMTIFEFEVLLPGGIRKYRFVMYFK